MLPVATALNTWEIISVVASVVAIVLAAFAIWQASTFYRWSNEASKDAKKSADAVGESVRKLEELFSRLYSDTFGMMRDTVSDMRKHMWPTSPEEIAADSYAAAEVEKRANENLAKVRDEVMSELRGLVEKVGATATQVSELEGSLGGAVDRAFSGSRAAAEEAIQDTIRDRLLSTVRRYRESGLRYVEADTLLRPLFEEFDAGHVHNALVGLKEQGIVDWDGDGWVDGPEVRVTLRPRRE
jgi:hypothetical protein